MLKGIVRIANSLAIFTIPTILIICISYKRYYTYYRCYYLIVPSPRGTPIYKGAFPSRHLYLIGYLLKKVPFPKGTTIN
jgi:hypothetical protein